MSRRDENLKVRALGIVGLMLALAAGLGWMIAGDGSAGDVAAVETSLVEAPVVEPAEPASEDLLPTTSIVAQQPGKALWTVNEDARLEQLEDDRGRVPIRLEIAGIGVDAPVEPYGIDESSQMDVPDNVRDVAWYEYGPSPGEDGSAVLAAHVDLAGSGPGVFFDLNSLDPGELVRISHRDGSESLFEVVARQTYLKEELPLDVLFSREGPPTLTLVTCGGGFSQSRQSYDSNVVVFAIPFDGPDGGIRRVW